MVEAKCTEGSEQYINSIYSTTLEIDEERDCDRFIMGIPYCGVELDCELYLLYIQYSRTTYSQCGSY